MGWLEELGATLPRHASVLSALAIAVERNEPWRSLLVGCSLGDGRGDELSDIDAGLAYRPPMAPDDLERLSLDLVQSAGVMVDALVHRLDGMDEDSARIAVEYDTGVQLDLVVAPAPWRRSRLRDVPIVDKDHDLADLVAAPDGLIEARTQRQAREWTMLGWWAVADIAKYLARDSLFEAAARIEAVREEALRLRAFAQQIPDPIYGLTSLLDYPPFQIPPDLAATYCDPGDRASVVGASRAVAGLLTGASRWASDVHGLNLSTGWERSARQRLEAATQLPVPRTLDGGIGEPNDGV